LTTSIQT